MIADQDELTIFQKTPNESRPYGFDYTLYLGTDTLVNGGTWTTSPAGLTIGATGFTSTQVSIRLSGGAVGEEYLVTNKTATVAGNTVERSFIIQVVTTRGK